MSGIIAVYSLVISVLIAEDLDPGKNYSLFSYVDAKSHQRKRTLTVSGVFCISDVVLQSA
jgi:hypothetical protein